MEFIKKNKKYFYIYFIVIFSFTIFYITLFVINRLQYLDRDLYAERERLSRYMDSVINVNLITNRNQILYFMNYVELLEYFYKYDTKNLQIFLNNNKIYSSIFIVNNMKKVLFEKIDKIDFVFNINSLLLDDSMKISIAFDNQSNNVYKIFTMPMKENNDIYVVAYLNMNIMHNLSHTYILAKDGELLSSSVEESGFDNFVVKYPNEWKQIVSDKNGQYISKYGIFTYRSLNAIGNINNIDIDQESSYIISIKHMDPKDNPYSINSISSFMKYVDFNVNIIYWIIGYVWIFFTSIAVFLIIINKLKNVSHMSLDEKLGVIDRKSGYEKIVCFANYINLPGILKILYIPYMILFLKKHIRSMHFCKIYINGLKRVSINLDHKYRDEVMKKVIDIVKIGLPNDSILIRISIDEFLIVFTNTKIESINCYYASMSKTFVSKNYNNDFKYKFIINHGVVKYKKYSDINDCINEASKIAYEEDKNNNVNLFFN